MLGGRDPKLGSLVLVVVIATLLLATGAFGWLTYRELYAIILGGFDRKLSAVSTATAAFIEGEDHEVLLRTRTLSGIAKAAGRPFAWAIDADSATLVEVHVSGGGARDLDELPLPDLTGLTLEGRRLLSVSAGSGRLMSLDPEAGEWREDVMLEPGLGDLAVSGDGVVIYAAGPAGLHAYERSTGAALPQRVRSGERPLAAVATDASGALFALADDGVTLLRFDHQAGTWIEKGPLRWEEGVESDVPPSPGVAMSVDPETGRLVVASDRLITVDTATAAADGAEHPFGYRNEADPLYVRYVTPMRSIMARKDLTYLYTQILLDRQGRIVYVLDGTLGDDHSPIGSEDQLPSDDVEGAEMVMTAGRVHLSDIQQWEQWGLLKTAFAPIRRSDGEAVAMAGADVNISTITTRTQGALARVGVAATLTILLGTLVTLRLARRLVAPLGEVKDGALRVAAGDLQHRLWPQPLDELNRLALSFNEMSKSLQTAVASLEREGAVVERLRRRRKLRQLLESPGGGARSAAAPAGVVWLGAPGALSLDTLRARREVEAVLARLRAAGGATGPGDWLDPWLADLRGAAVAFDEARSCVVIVAGLPATCTVRGPGDREESRVVDGAEAVALEAGQVVRVALAPLPGAGAAGGEPPSVAFTAPAPRPLEGVLPDVAESARAAERGGAA